MKGRKHGSTHEHATRTETRTNEQGGDWLAHSTINEIGPPHNMDGQTGAKHTEQYTVGASFL